MRYETIDALDSRIERIIKAKTKHYYSDWKNYDRPKYMRFKGSNDRKDKQLVLIVRECGTYLLRQADLTDANGSEFSKTIYNYYRTADTGDYYNIDLDRLAIAKAF